MQRRNYNARPSHRYTPGDKIYLFTPPTGRNEKLTCPWTGPFDIITRRGETGYMIQPMREGRRKVVHYDRLKPCYQRASKEISETVNSPADAPNNNQEDPPAQTRLQAVSPPLHSETTLEQGPSTQRRRNNQQMWKRHQNRHKLHQRKLVPHHHLTNSNITRLAMYVKPRTDRLMTPWT